MPEKQPENAQNKPVTGVNTPSQGAVRLQMANLLCTTPHPLTAREIVAALGIHIDTARDILKEIKADTPHGYTLYELPARVGKKKVRCLTYILRTLKKRKK